MSKISHILLKNPVVVPTGTKLIEAAKLMKRNKVANVLVSTAKLRTWQWLRMGKMWVL